MEYNFLRTVAEETGRRRTSTSTEASPHEQKQKQKHKAATTTMRALQQRDKNASRRHKLQKLQAAKLVVAAALLRHPVRMGCADGWAFICFGFGLHILAISNSR
jgi:hypothetical protein